MIRYQPIVGIIAIALASPTAKADCPFCCYSNPRTLRQQVADANVVLICTPCHSILDPNAANNGTTYFQIDTVIKAHSVVNGLREFTANHYVPVDKAKPVKMLVLCDVTKGKLNPYSGIALEPGSKMPDYLKGSLQLLNKDTATRLAYFVNFLENQDKAIADDAFLEFSKAEIHDFRPLASKLNPDLLVRWIKDSHTLTSRMGLYASMLGDCGKPEHAQMLREILDGRSAEIGTAREGLIVGYLKLRPKEAWRYIRDIFRDSKKDFLIRYAALRAARFAVDSRPDLLSKDEMVDGICLMLPQSDMADLVIDDLRKFKRWDLTDKVLDLANLPSHKVPIIQLAALRFAVPSANMGNNARAAAYVSRRRAREADLVKDIEEEQQLESNPPPNANAPGQIGNLPVPLIPK